MSKIGPKSSKLEIFIRKLVYSLGYRFSLHNKDLPGKPDIVFPKHKKVIFVNGCFWHNHRNCPRAKLPHTNYNFWQKKIKRNVENDKRNYQALKKIGWKYLVLWQCDIKKRSDIFLKNKIRDFLNNPSL